MGSSEVVEIAVKERCWEQREALPGEPRCTICARYGEYICDETDDDVCSKECKGILLERFAKALKVPKVSTCPVKVPVRDECFYVRDHDSEYVESLRKKIGILVKGHMVPPPVISFSSCNLPVKLQENLESTGYEIPTPVQMQVIPAALARQNLLVSAETGSGKTAAFLVPLISHCANCRMERPDDRSKPLAMVLAPTRELCIQVEEQAKILGKGMQFKTALVVGGDAMAGQVYRIQQGVELVVGTPGRLIDLLSKHNFELDDIAMLVLDEIDCMMQKGFRDQVMQIFLALSSPQILMFSATVSSDVEKITNSMAKDLKVISLRKSNKPKTSVKQVVIWVESKHKKQKLFEILTSKQHFKPPVVVFVESRMGAELLSEAVTAKTGIKALPIHGEKSMKERRETLGRFLSGEIPVIVATGVLGRGLDLLSVKQVIIFDMPTAMEEYIHQIGRVSRMGEEGTHITFVNEENKKLFKEFVQYLKSSGAAIPRELVNSYYSSDSHHMNGRQKKRKWGV